MISQAMLDRIEAMLRGATFWMFCGSLALMVGQGICYVFYGTSSFFALAGIGIAVSAAAMMLFATFCVLRYRSLFALPGLTLVAILAFAPIITTGGQWQWFIPNLILGVLLTIVAIGQRMLAPKSESVRQRIHSVNTPDEEPAERKVAYKFPAVRPKVTFADVTGMADVKERLFEAGMEIVQEQRRLGEESFSPRNGILLFGEPGNGKTMFAEALAGQLNLPFIPVTFGDVASSWVNQTTEQVMRAFRDARAQSPCVLFLDEIDSLIKDRNAAMAGGTEESAKTTNAILTELVKARDSMIVVVAATNFLDKLDRAAIREGRFDFKVEITPPDEPARAAIIRSTASKHRGIQLAPEAVALAARRWSGFSVARIRTVADEACRAAAKAARGAIEYTHLQEALRTIQGRKGVLPENTPSVDELIMMPSQKQRLLGIAARMRDIERIEELGGTVPSGVLFWGPPGTGKTLTARALAKSSGWGFISASGNELLGKPDRIEELAREARDIRPCIVFLDEADDVLADRRYAPHSASVTNRLLTAIDGAGGKTHDVVWIAATNHPENMDSAALRGGRFTEKVEFALPDHSVIAEFVRSWMAKSKARFDASVTPEVAAELLEGLSVANIAAVLQQAADLMVERCVVTGNEGSATLEDLSTARSSVVDAI